MNQINLLLNKIFGKYRCLILYGLIGSVSAGLDFILYTVLCTYLDFYYLYANILSVVVGISISFILNRHYNFKVKDRVLCRLILFFSVGLLGLALSSGLLVLFIDSMGWNVLISKLLSIIFVVIIQFCLNRFITFKE